MDIRRRLHTWVVRARRRAIRPQVLFGGVYGAVLASSMVAALNQSGETSQARHWHNAAWLLVTALASALAHGYAHHIAERGEDVHHGALAAVSAVVDEWPLLAATAPSFVMLLGAGLGWWPSQDIEYVALAFNTLLLFFWGLAAGRAGGRTWPAALRTGTADAFLGVLVIVANALIK
ncbi:hypothetical protein [Streptomyces pinistramenti]|uniref:hypothetical protein n=1 Tax=Streptomyces pinistramenti TaxID=2884812 RepID=UPI001D05C6C4|nr:hypothetical protein [Streptomyces pinistramenti]MCB5907511.1 hypothetical protein [Streptomyces pinistramenti]